MLFSNSLLSRPAQLLVLTAILAVPTMPLFEASASENRILVAFDNDFKLDSLKLQDADAKLVVDGDARVLQVSTGHESEWPGITIDATGQAWDLSSYQALEFKVQNLGATTITVNCRVDGPGEDIKKDSLTERVKLAPNESKQLTVMLRAAVPSQLSKKLFGMRGYPGGALEDKGLDTSNIRRLTIFVNKPKQDHSFQLTDILARGVRQKSQWREMTADKFFPMIDQFGQFKHKTWPQKIESKEGLLRDRETEQTDIANHPGPPNWNQYGGWKAGPQLTKKGFFYPHKQDGKWWLVDPDGRLFWSHGADCVSFSQGTTPITDREFYYAWLPDENSPFAEFYGSASWAPHGYYKDKGSYRTFNFTGANLMRKYGSEWYAEAAEMCHVRLRSWSMNTIANWSDSRIYLLRKTPYVVSISNGRARPIEGSDGYWGKFPDPFDSSFRQSLDRRMNRERGRSAGDPWCIGFFVDNELAWGEELSLAIATLASPAEQASKQVFIKDLKKKYESVQSLNQVWGTEHASWDALLNSNTPPDKEKAKDDLGAFYTRIAEEYFRHCREAVKQVAPNNLYLGCRFAWVNDRGARAAAKYCDVIGYNLYRDSVADFRLPDGVDMPVVIGEFHFGALDRGMFHTGLRPTASQEARAQAYRDYVTEALKNPSLVGSHWFQFGDQATTGRGDGENYQIGLITTCDRPYPETIRAVREVGDAMYETRFAE